METAVSDKNQLLDSDFDDYTFDEDEGERQQLNLSESNDDILCDFCWHITDELNEKDPVASLPIDVISCFMLNTAQQKNIGDFIKLIDAKLEANKQMRDELTVVTEGNDRIQIQSVIDVKGFHPPANEDVKKKKNNGEVNQVMFYANKPWTDEEKEELKSLIKRHKKEYLYKTTCMERKIKKSALEEARKNKEPEEVRNLEEEIKILDQEIDRINNLELEVSPSREESDHIDWSYISTELQRLKKSDKSDLECELKWLNHLHRDINNDDWSEDEEERLKELVSEFGTNWDLIAENLGTNRLAWQCFCHYQSELNDKMKRDGPLSKAEAKTVEEVISLLRIGDFIPWQQVNYFIDGRTTFQIKHYWNKINMPKRGEPWNELEDKVLIAAVRKYGISKNNGNEKKQNKRWQKVAYFLPGRTNRQCRERYTLRLGVKERKIGNYSIEEDKLILKYAKLFNYEWVKIEEMIKERNAKQIANRFAFLIRCFEKNDLDFVLDHCVTDEHLPIETLSRKIRLKPKNFRIVKQEMIRFFDESAVEGAVEDIDTILYFGRQQLKQQLKAEIRRKERNVTIGRPCKTGKESSIEKQIMAILRPHTYFQRNVRGQNKFTEISFQDHYISEEVKKCLTSILKGEAPETTHLLSKVTNIAISSNVDFRDIESRKFIPVIPPNRTTISAYKALRMLRPYLLNKLSYSKHKNNNESREITNDPNFIRLFQQFLSLFFWSMLFTLESPPDNFRTDSCPKVPRGDAGAYLSKIRDVQNYLVQTAVDLSNDDIVDKIKSQSNSSKTNDDARASTSTESDKNSPNNRPKSKRHAALNCIKNLNSKKRKIFTSKN
ncbi:snRNA-activating protein complex subunit 4-like protein [Dinothrombium tinctorium]|uniref:snRNA-activating protein complex subunit 4-like protein n=1 Tax=Dinothrombium tinctorium TaxID=1965070 RepID=A0A3S3RZ23_9ACAR|nr:snRNA-activating protein complex subunit 4-like protein [Dinothrombium tinctorium]